MLNAIPANPHDPAKRIAVVAASLRPELVVVDASGDTQSIRLLRNARQCGCKTVDGLAVFIEQVALAFLHWTDVDPDRNILREAAEEFLEL